MAAAWRAKANPRAQILLALEDVTLRRRAEEALRRSNLDLEQFASMASHDLREPLRTIGAFSELLSKQYKGKLDSQADEYIGFVQTAVARMNSLITDLLAYSSVAEFRSEPNGEYSIASGSPGDIVESPGSHR